MLTPFLLSALLLAAHISGAHAATAPNCPYQGPAFPKPTALASSPSMKDALANLTATFTQRDLDPANNPNTTSYSVEIYSASQDTPVWSWDYTSPEMTIANTSGVNKVDSNTVFRLGSVTKIFTILAYLAEVGDSSWSQPVTKYVPELASLAAKYKDNPVMNVDWADVTLGGLASQMTGIVRDYGILGELTQEMNQSYVQALGFPPAAATDIPTCGEWPLCNRTEFFDGLSKVPPSFVPWETAAYSDVGFQILAYALESISGKKFADVLQSDILDKLGLKHTYYTTPPNSVGALPPGNKTGWSYNLGDGSPAGNMYSSVGDLSTLGRAIFRYDVMSGPQTRRWLKPASLTSELVAGVGYPWGVRRIPIGTGNNAHRVVDAYGKAGRVGSYASLMILLPDYDVGINALIAGNAIPGNANWNIADAVGGILLPALESAAREQAQATYAGKYTSSDDHADSNLVLSTQSDRPGLGIDTWVSNGTDMKTIATVLSLGYSPVPHPSIRLYPTGLETTNDDGTKTVAFKAAYEDLDAPSRAGAMFSTDCGTWVSQTAASYVRMPLDQFTFTLDKSGKVLSIRPLALKINLKKT